MKRNVSSPIIAIFSHPPAVRPLASESALADAKMRARALAFFCRSKLVPVAGEQHAGRAGFHRRAGQVEDPQQAARPERDIVLQGELPVLQNRVWIRKKTDAMVIALNLECLYGDNMLCFCQVLIDNIKDFAPIIYTPTVGLVCENYSGLFRRPRGMYFSAKDKGEMMSMIYNWPAEKV